MGYHPFELIRLVSAHTRTTAEGFFGISGGASRMDTESGHYAHNSPLPPSFRFRSQHIPLSRFRATRAFFPSEKNKIHIQPGGHHAAGYRISKNVTKRSLFISSHSQLGRLPLKGTTMDGQYFLVWIEKLQFSEKNTLSLKILQDFIIIKVKIPGYLTKK